MESNWNECLYRVEEIKEKMAVFRQTQKQIGPAEKELLRSLSDDLPALWAKESTTNEMRKKIIRTVIEEIIVDVDNETRLIQLDIHWKGGFHTHIDVRKSRTGVHNNTTEKSTVDLVRQLATQLPDKMIPAVLNRLQLTTGCGNRWTRDRVRRLRQYHGIPCFSPQNHSFYTLQDAAKELNICSQTVKNLIKQNIIRAEQICPFAPWAIEKKELEREEVRKAAQEVRKNKSHPKKRPWCEKQLSLIQENQP